MPNHLEPSSSESEPTALASEGVREVLAPPAPERRPFRLPLHGDVRTDDYFWLSDRHDPAVIGHLEAENAYTDASLIRLQPLRDRLFDEMVARIVETDLTVPVRRADWWYYQRTIEGASYAVHCRRPVLNEGATGPPMDSASGPSGLPVEPVPDEEILLDENELAVGHEYLAVGNLSVSPDHHWLAYSADTTGGELYQLHFRRLGGSAAEFGSDPDSGSPSSTETVTDTYYGLAWANDNATVFYTRVDEAMRPCSLWRHRVGDDPATDERVLFEDDERFSLGVGRTKDGAYIVVAVSSTTSSECWVIPADHPVTPPRLIERRRPDVEYAVEHVVGKPGSGWFLILTNDGAKDFRLMVAPDLESGRPGWRQVVGERAGTRLDGVDPFNGWLALTERLDAESRIRIAPLRPPSSPDPFGDDLLADSWLVPTSGSPSTMWEGANPEPGSRFLRLEETSLVSPRTVFELDLDVRSTTVLKRQPVRGSFQPDDYRTFRLWATGKDGTAIPVSVVHRADLLADRHAAVGTAPCEPAPCLLYGYGAYEHSVDPAFSSLRLSLLDRGFVYAIAHVRGGGELGRQWYEDGKLAAKTHTFDDFIAVAEHLIELGFTTPDRLAARGASAGGLLIGAVLNRAPDLFRAAVAEVPFVDCLTTMCDESLPLTIGEWEEWGNPVADAQIYEVMRNYSPYDNVRGQGADGRPASYPDLLVTAGLNDQRVGYWEPTKWVAKLRLANPGNRVLLRTEMGAGHGGPSGRYDSWREEALVVAFLIDALGGGQSTADPEPAASMTNGVTS